MSKQEFFNQIAQGNKVEIKGGIHFEEDGEALNEFVQVSEIKIKN
jgi:hypothetical protein